MENLQQKVINWVKTLKGWQCELAYRLLIKEKLENSDIDEIVSMLKEEKQFEDKVFPNIGISKLLQKSEMRKDIVIELSYKGFG